MNTLSRKYNDSLVNHLIVVGKNNRHVTIIWQRLNCLATEESPNLSNNDVSHNVLSISPVDTRSSVTTCNKYTDQHTVCTDISLYSVHRSKHENYNYYRENRNKMTATMRPSCGCSASVTWD